MKQTTKRLLSALLCLAMVLAMLPMAVFAEETTTTPATLYVKPNSNWLVDGARFAAVLATEGWSAQIWVDASDADGDGYYEVAIPDDGNAYSIVIFCRMNPNAAENNWSNKWNQTDDLTIPTDGTCCYVVADGTWDAGGGEWVTYSPDTGAGETTPTEASPIEYSVAGSAELCGNAWAPSDVNNMMTDEDGDGVYTITYSEVAAGSYEFKVTDGTWSNSWGTFGTTKNYALNLVVKSNVTINFDSNAIGGETDPISVTVEALEELPSTEATEPVALDYYLFGYINGADYACNDDYANLGEYKFVDGTLVATFETDSYVAVKTSDNAGWYMTEGFDASLTTVTLYNTNSDLTDANKMYVPGGVEITFTLVVNEDDTLTLSAAYELPVVESDLVLGDNSLTLAAGDLDGDTWTYIPTEDGTLTLNVTYLAYDWMGEGEYTEAPVNEIPMGFPKMYAIVVNGTTFNASTAEIAVTAGEAYAIQIYSFSAYATNLTLNLVMGEPQEVVPAEPGTQDNPFVIESLPYEITVEGEHDVYYTYTAAADGVIVISRPSGNLVSGLPNYENDDAGNYYVTVTAGQTITINPWGSNAGTYTIAYGEAPVYEDVNVYFDASLYGWTNVYAYAWNDNSTISAEWPGTAMTQNEDGIWTIALPENATYIIFNNGADYQTWNLTFGADMIYNGFASGIYGTEISTSFYVTGSDVFGGWVPNNANGLMTNNGDGTFSVTFEKVPAGSYEYKVTNGTWDISWGDWATSSGNYELTVDALSDVTFVFNLNTQIATATATAVTCVVPTLTPHHPSLSFKGEVYINVYFYATDIDDVVEMGLVTSADETVDETDTFVPGYEVSGSYYIARTNGISAKNLGDTIYFRTYAKLADGTYVYSANAYNYSALDYAKDRIANSTSAEMKALAVAMLNYGAAAQVYFDYKTDSLMNADLTDEQKALVSDYSSDMVAAISSVDSAKIGDFTYNSAGYSKRRPSVSFTGAFAINYYFTPKLALDGDMTLYYWTQAAYDSAEVLTAENASGTVTMELQSNGEYLGVVSGIAAKDIDSTIFVSGVYESEGVSYATGVLAYSLGAYCVDRATNSTSATMVDFAEATAVYGYYAKQYFAA